ncbi:TPA: hypothetical protein P2R04_001207 [Aeromonas veronii]|nr:hypothetical protein [Aeromonas veronii]
MSLNNDFYSGCDDHEWINSYTKLYIQELYCKEPQSRIATLYFRPHNVDATYFYQSCSEHMLEMITHVQLSLIGDCCIAYNKSGRRPSQIFFKIEPRIIPSVIDSLLESFSKLRDKRIELVLDMNFQEDDFSKRKIDSKLCRELYKVVDRGYRLSMGGFDWKHNAPENIGIVSDLFDYVRLGPPPSNIAEVNHFIDTCFYIKENNKSLLILERLQCKTDLETACRVPYYALMGDYIYPSFLAKDIDSVDIKVLL